MMSNRSGARRSNGDRRPWRPQRGDPGRGVSFRLTLLAAMFFLVLLLMFEARQPKNWRWMFADRPRAATSADAPRAGGRADGASESLAENSAPLETTEGGAPDDHASAPPDASLARSLFVNIDPKQFDSLTDGQMLADDDDLLLKILYGLPRWGPGLTERMRRPSVSWRQAAEDLDSHRMQVYRVRGRVREANRVELPEEQAALLEYDHYFRVRLDMTDAPFSAWIFARRVPHAWETSSPLGQRASALALLLGDAATKGETPQLLLAASRIAWSPDREAPELGVGAGLALLGRLDMDIGLLDDVRDRGQKPMGAEDRECFYQLLAAAGRAPPSPKNLSSLEGFDLASLLGDPESQLGRVGVLQAAARRITEIRVDDPDVRTRLGVSRYWQVDAFAPLEGATVRLGRQEGGEEGPVFRNRFPVTLCCLRLPPDLAGRTADSGGELDLNETVRLVCFFFRNWAYRSQYVSSFDEKQLQVSPMFVGATLEKAAPPSSWPRLGAVFGLVFILVLACLWFGLWRQSRSDRKFGRQLRRGRAPSGEGWPPSLGPIPPGASEDGGAQNGDSA